MLGERAQYSGRRLLAKLNCESRQRGKGVHETVLSLCERKRLTWELVPMRRCVLPGSKRDPSKTKTFGSHSITSRRAASHNKYEPRRSHRDFERISHTRERVTPRSRFLRDGDA